MRRFLLPREHGAYAQLTFPLLSGLLLGGPTAVGFAFVIVVVGFFLAYEPVAVLLGVRGVRLQKQDSGTARRQLAAIVPLTLLAGTVAITLADAWTRVTALIPVGFCLLLIPLVPGRKVKTLAGEMLVAGALAGMHLPVAAAGGARGLPLWGPSLVWFATFVVGTLAVHAIKARLKAPDRRIGAATAISCFAGLKVALMLLLLSPPARFAAAALAVPLLATLAVHVRAVHPRSLKRVGWTMVAADSVSLALLALL